jgi:hypothetical protein
MSQPRGFTCIVEIAPLIIEIQRSANGLWIMQLFDNRARARVIMPPSEFDLDAAKQKALTSTEFYMRKHGGDPLWTRPAAVDWREFTPRDVIWET